MGNAVCRCDPSREKAILENPQIFQNCKYKNKISAEDGQSAAEAIQIVYRGDACKIKAPGFSTFRRKGVENPGVLFLQSH